MLTQTTIRTAERVTEALRELVKGGDEAMGRVPIFCMFSVEESNEPLYVSRVNDGLGTAGIEILRGANACAAATERYLQALGLRPADDTAALRLHDVDLLTIVWTTLENIPESLRELPYALGYRGRRETFAPDLAVTLNGQSERPLRPPELRIAERVLRGLLQAGAEGLLDCKSIDDPRTIMHFKVAGEGRDWRVSRGLDRLTFPEDALLAMESLRDSVAECPDGDPATADTDTWRRVGQACHAKLFERAKEVVERLPRLADKFFGVPDEGMELMEEMVDWGGDSACLRWIAMYHRDKTTKSTILERMLVESTSRLEREFILTWMQAKISAFRITGLARGESVALIDLVDGHEWIAHDRLLSEADASSAYVFGWAFTVHGHGYLLPLTPFLGIVHYEAAVEFLAAERVKLNHASLAKKPEVLGHVFDVIAGLVEEAAEPNMTNTDGEELINVCATFMVGDDRALREALAERRDVRLDDDDVYAWFRTPEDGPGVLVGNTHLARLERIGDELIVYVNSEGRLERIKEWLTRIPGVRFERARKEPFDPNAARPPGASADLPEIDDEMMSAIADAMRQQMMMWLEMPIPALGGKTPRECAKTAAGRAKVKSMILAMPPIPVGPNRTIEPPREEMFRELGLA